MKRKETELQKSIGDTSPLFLVGAAFNLLWSVVPRNMKKKRQAADLPSGILGYSVCSRGELQFFEHRTGDCLGKTAPALFRRLLVVFDFF